MRPLLRSATWEGLRRGYCPNSAFQLFLRSQRPVECALRVVFMCDRRAAQGEDAVAGGLDDVAAIALHLLHHQREDRVDNRASFLGASCAFRRETDHHLPTVLIVEVAYPHPAQRVAADVRDDSQDPGSVPQRLEAQESGKECFLDDILGLVCVEDSPRRMSRRTRPVSLE